MRSWLGEQGDPWWRVTRFETLCHFDRSVAKAELFCEKRVIPVTGLRCLPGEVFIPDAEISVGNTKI